MYINCELFNLTILHFDLTKVGKDSIYQSSFFSFHCNPSKNYETMTISEDDIWDFNILSLMKAETMNIRYL